MFTGFTPYLPYAAALIIAIPFLVLLRQFVYSYIKLKNKELKLLASQSSGENRTHSYERMTLFLERIKPSNLVQKFDKNLAPHEFLFLTEKTVSEEFEYNSSQQLYISRNSWQNIVESKNAVVALLNKTYEDLSQNSDLDDFKTVFIMNYVNGEDYIAATIEDLRRETLLLS
jgi:hypothetical protein